jgi:hypothetical protein
MTGDRPADESFSELSDADARRLIARAIELEAEIGDHTTFARVREIAKDAGISELALSRAITELRAPAPALVKAPAPARESLWDRLRHRLLANYQPTPIDSEPLVPNLLVGASFWFGALLLAQVGHLFGTLGVEASIIVSSLTAAFIARKSRARLATFALLGFTAFQAAEFLMHARFGVDSVQGGPTHWAVMIAGMLGVALGARFAGPADAPSVAPPARDAAHYARPDAASGAVPPRADGRNESGGHSLIRALRSRLLPSAAA